MIKKSLYWFFLFYSCLQAQLSFNLEHTSAYHSNLTTDYSSKSDFLFCFSGLAAYTRGKFSLSYQPDIFLPVQYHEFLNYSHTLNVDWTIKSMPHLNSKLTVDYFQLTFPDTLYREFTNSSYQIKWFYETDINPDWSLQVTAGFHYDQYPNYSMLDDHRFTGSLKTFYYWSFFTFRPELEYGYKQYHHQAALSEFHPHRNDFSWNNNPQKRDRYTIQYDTSPTDPQYLLPGLAISRPLGEKAGVYLNLYQNILISSYAARPQNDETFYFYPLWDDRYAYSETQYELGFSLRPDPQNTLRVSLEMGDRNYPSFRMVLPRKQISFQRQDNYQSYCLNWSSDYCFQRPLFIKTEIVYTHHHSNYWFYHYDAFQSYISLLYQF